MLYGLCGTTPALTSRRLFRSQARRRSALALALLHTATRGLLGARLLPCTAQLATLRLLGAWA